MTALRIDQCFVLLQRDVSRAEARMLVSPYSNLLDKEDLQEHVKLLEVSLQRLKEAVEAL
jgi:hypothetical protein